MTDIGSVRQPFTVSAITQDPLEFLRPAWAADAGRLDIGASVPLPRNHLGRRIAGWAVGVFSLVRAKNHTTGRSAEPDRRYRHPRREAFLEEAAMSREMRRL